MTDERADIERYVADQELRFVACLGRLALNPKIARKVVPEEYRKNQWRTYLDSICKLAPEAGREDVLAP